MRELSLSVIGSPFFLPFSSLAGAFVLTLTDRKPTAEIIKDSFCIRAPAVALVLTTLAPVTIIPITRFGALVIVIMT